MSGVNRISCEFGHSMSAIPGISLGFRDLLSKSWSSPEDFAICERNP